MKYTFNHIQWAMEDSKLTLTLSNDEGILVDVTLAKHRVMKMYPKEFSTYRKVTPPDSYSEPYYIPIGEISFEEWYREFMNEEKAWDIYSNVGIDDYVLVE